MAKDIPKCPICNNDLEHWADYLDGTLLMEEEDKCLPCKYVRYYAYGGTQVTLNNKTWEWSWKSENADKITAEINKVIQAKRVQHNDDRL